MEGEGWHLEELDFHPRAPGVMRKGHRRRLAREGDKESGRGRARYSQSVGKGHARLPKQQWKAKSLRFAQEAELIEDGLDALKWEATDYAALSAWYEEEVWATDFEEDLICCEVQSSSEDSMASWSIISTTCSLSDDEASMEPSRPATVVRKPRCTRWAEAEANAALRAEEYFAEMTQPAEKQRRARRLPKVQKAAALGLKAAAPMDPGFSYAPRLSQPPSTGGQPHPDFQAEHDAALSFTEFCRPGRYGAGSMRDPVARTSAEFKAVTDYFLYTLGLGGDIEVKELRRLGSAKALHRFACSGDVTLMFHGCKSAANEAKILQEGFKVRCCSSGGANYGTWFAYNARYSNSGFAFMDADGFMHMFICVVSYHYTVMDNSEMRVVGQDCAYPQWLIKYKVPQNRFALNVRRKVYAGSNRVWHVVRDGKWVRETVGT